MARGRRSKTIRINQSEVNALCSTCHYSRCRGMNDPYCPVRIASRAKWAEYNRRRWAAKKAEKEIA